MLLFHTKHAVLLLCFLFVSWQPACSQVSVVALLRVQKSMTFPGYLSANSEEAGYHASLSNLKTQAVTSCDLKHSCAHNQAESVRPSSPSHDWWVRYLHKFSHPAIDISEGTHVKNFSWQHSFQVHVRTMRFITLTVNVCALTVFSGPGVCRPCVMHA